RDEPARALGHGLRGGGVRFGDPGGAADVSEEAMSTATVVISLLLGASFGFILQRVQASSPDRIIATLTLRDVTILKFMLLAIGVGAVGIGLLTSAGLAHLNVKALPLLAVAFGGLIFG